jgi:hypothetical protein
LIVSKYGKSYDTADGSEQHSEIPAHQGQSGREAGVQRWQDDGGADGRPDGDEGSAAIIAPKPAWSVLSARDLGEAIRRERRADDPARLRRKAEENERREAHTSQLADEKAADATRASHDRHRNDWEHS